MPIWEWTRICLAMHWAQVCVHLDLVSERRDEKEPHVLCYEHHVEMKIGRAELELRDESAETPLYGCQEPGCPVHYASSRGYFIVAQGANASKRETEPRVRCPKDGRLMYLAKVEPAKKSFRLWRCPECAASHTNQEIS